MHSGLGNHPVYILVLFLTVKIFLKRVLQFRFFFQANFKKRASLR